MILRFLSLQDEERDDIIIVNDEFVMSTEEIMVRFKEELYYSYKELFFQIALSFPENV